jgi:hypothetical protein
MILAGYTNKTFQLIFINCFSVEMIEGVGWLH